MISRRRNGFSLIELAIVLLVVSILTAGLITMFRVQREHAAISETRAALDEAKEALFAYAEINKGLPCPDTDNDGLENTGCDNNHRRGQLPWKTLGLSQGSDAWSQSLRYLVSPNLIPGALTKLVKHGDGDIYIDDGTPSSVVTQTAAAFAVWSVGPDGSDSSQAEALNSNKVMTGSTAAPSDDIVIWGSYYVLVGRILQAGQTLTLM
jgi:prepilin-type N-terminal cleavage/methylation domain-containing protein